MPSAGEDVVNNGSSPMLPVGVQNGAATRENGLAVPHKVQHTHTVQPSNPTFTYLHTHPREIRTYVHTKTCTLMSIADLCVITQS